MGALVVGLGTSLIALSNCFEWPGQLFPRDHCPIASGDSCLAGNSGLIDLAESLEGRGILSLYLEEPKALEFSSALCIWVLASRRAFLVNGMLQSKRVTLH